MNLKPFKKLPLLKFFQHDLERIKMAFRLSGTISKDISNIRAGGDEIEIAVKEFFQERLHPRYHVSDGHIVDKNLKVSPQFDLIISENSKNPVLFNIKDKSEILFYEPVFSFGEIKRSLYNDKLIPTFCRNLKRVKKQLKRADIPPNFIETGNSGLQVESNLTKLPLRNPLLTFMFFVDSSNLSHKKLKELIDSKKNDELPNYIVFLDQGILVNVSEKEHSEGRIKINLYPEYTTEENFWALLHFEDENSILIYQYLLLLGHLNSSVVSSAPIKAYSELLLNFSLDNLHKI